MKTAVMNAQRFLNRPYVSLPNAATRRQVLKRLLDTLLVGVSCVGIVVAILFLIILA